MAIDPFALIDRRFARLYADPLAEYFGSAPRATSLADLAPEDDALLSQLAGGAGSALGYIGATLDKPGRAVRGLLGGQGLGALANLVPFSDTLGLTDPQGWLGNYINVTDSSKTPSGRDLLEQVGALGPNTPGFDWGDVAGFAADVALDPLTYMTLGGSALGKGGQIAGKLGIVPKTRFGRLTSTLGDVLTTPELMTQASEAVTKGGIDLAEHLNKPLGGLVGFGVPFMEPSAVVGTGPLAQKIAGGLDATQEFIAGLPGVRHLNALFNKGVLGFTNREAQLMAEGTSERIRAAESTVRQQAYEAENAFHKTGWNTPEHLRSARQYAEGLAPDIAPPPEVANAIDTMKALKESERLKLWENGIDTPTIEDIFNTKYFARREMLPGVSTKGYMRRDLTLEPGHPSQLRRKEPLRDIPGGSTTISDISIDPIVSGPDRSLDKIEDATKYIWSKYLGFGRPERQEYNQLVESLTTKRLLSPEKNAGQLWKELRTEYYETGKVADPDAMRFLQLHTVKRRGKQLAELAAKQDPKRASEQLRYFGHHLADDFQDSSIAAQKAFEFTEGAYKLLAPHVTEVPSQDSVPLWQVLISKRKGMGLTAKDFVEEIGKDGTLVQRPIYKAAEKITGMTGHNVEDFKNLYVPKDIAGEVTRAWQRFSSPKEVADAVKFWDQTTNFFKTALTSIRGKFHIRNFYSGQGVNFLTGLLDDPRLLADADRLMSGQWDKIKRFNPEQIAKEIYSQSVWTPHTLHPSAEIAGSDLSGISSLIAGRTNPRAELLETAKHIPSKETFRDIFGIRGVKEGQRVTTNPLVKSGEIAGSYIEGLNRIAPYVSQRLKGVAPAEAAARVRAAHVDYNNLSQFERNVMRRLIPFYSWSRGIAPFIFKDLIEHPGGGTRQVIRATEALRDEEGFVPEHVGANLAINLGESAPGTTKFLSGIDLAHETLNDLFKPGLNTLDTITNTGSALLGQFHPWLKMPLELASGKQFYSGRDLADLQSRIPGIETGPNSILANEVLMNMPLTGTALTTLGKWTDPRKSAIEAAFNTLVGLRTTDVELDKAKDRAAQESIDMLLTTKPEFKTFKNLYVDSAVLPTLSEEEQRLYALYGDISKRARQRAKLRRQQEAFAP